MDSENAKRAVGAACSLAKQNGSELLVVHVVSEAIPAQYSPIGINTPAADYTDYFKTIEQEGMKLVNQVVQNAKGDGINARGEVLRTISSTVESIVEVSDKEHVDLIVVGTRGLRRIQETLAGQRFQWSSIPRELLSTRRQMILTDNSHFYSVFLLPLIVTTNIESLCSF